MGSEDKQWKLAWRDRGAPGKSLLHRWALFSLGYANWLHVRML